jgi:predicted glycogen debranching enzyme
LVTNGLGGYASGTLAGPNTRRYHGLLVAALAPPVERAVLVGSAVEWVAYAGQRYPLFAFEYADGTIDRAGYQHVQSFALDGALPVWTYALADALLEKRVWMGYGANTTYVSYRLLRATRPVELEITPLVTYRDFHALSRPGAAPAVDARATGATIRFDGARPLHLLGAGARFARQDAWFEHFFHRVEAERGFDDTESDLYAPGAFAATLQPGETWTLVLSAEAQPDTNAAGALAAGQERQRELLHRARAEDSDPAVQQLVLAADQFIVRRGMGVRGWAMAAIAPTPNPQPLTPGMTVIAGYHWFND